MLTDQPLFRARALEPLTALGGVLYLLDQTGPLGYFAVLGIEPIEGLQPHDQFMIWSQGAAAPAGYGTGPGNTSLPAGTPTGSIAAGSFAEFSQPAALQQLRNQLLHCRFTIKATALTGINVHDLELQVFLPTASGRFGINGLGGAGYLNMSAQAQDPADSTVLPAQGAAQALPAAFPAVSPLDQINSRELFILGLNGPKFRLWNNGAASVTAGTVGLRIRGNRYDLAALSQDLTWVKRWVYGRLRMAPPVDGPIPVVQTATFAQTTGF